MAPAQVSFQAAPARPQTVRSGPATIAIDGQLVQGRVLSAHAGLGLFVFVLDEASERSDMLAEGTPCRIKWPGSDDFGAEAELVEAEDEERWVLSVPVQLSAAAMRQSPRLLADGGWGLVTDEGDLLEVYDLSEEGIGIEFPAGGGPTGIGDRIEGRLQAIGLGSWDVVIECTNVRAHPDDGRHWIVGGRMNMGKVDGSEQYQGIIRAMN
jgi:hypothetical protein